MGVKPLARGVFMLTREKKDKQFTVVLLHFGHIFVNLRIKSDLKQQNENGAKPNNPRFSSSSPQTLPTFAAAVERAANRLAEENGEKRDAALAKRRRRKRVERSCF